MDILTKKQQEFCENAGIFGVLLSLTCLIQHIILMIPGWLTYSIIPVYFLACTGFVLLAKKSSKAYIVIFTGTVLILLVEVLMIISGFFSLVMLILLIYSIVIIVLMTMNEIQKKLKQKELLEKEEKEKWDNLLP